jgi:hypothetical protein
MPAVGVASVNLAALITRNMYAMAFPRQSDSHYLLVSKLCIPLVLLASIPVSLILNDFIAILSFLITFGAFMGTAGFMLYFWRRLTPQAVMTGMIVWLVLMSIVPWILPISSSFSRDPALLRVGRPQQAVFSVPASASQVAAGTAQKVGQLLTVKKTLPAPSLFFDELVRSNPADPHSPMEGRGRFNVETYIMACLGVPVTRFNAANLYTCRWLFDGLFPAFMLVTLSYLPLARLGRSRAQWHVFQEKQQALDDRFFVKMKTKVIPDWDADKRQLEVNYAHPHALDHLKIFPKSAWEFTRWTWDESVGFAVCWVVAFAILGLLWAVVSIGA